MNFLYPFVLKSIICSGVFLLYYFVALRNKTFNQYNRFYILCSIIFSLILPVFKFEVIFEKPHLVQQYTFNYYQTIFLNNTVELKQHFTSWFTVENSMLSITLLVATVGLLYILKTFIFIKKLHKSNEHLIMDDVKVVITKHDSTPFSFWKTVYWNNGISLNNQEGRLILQHELAHIKDKHTIDKLFVNIVTAICWFNPFF